MRNKFDGLFAFQKRPGLDNGNRRQIARRERSKSSSLTNPYVKEKGKNSRAAFKFGVSYNSILDDPDNEKEDAADDQYMSFNSIGSSTLHSTMMFSEDTQPSHILSDDDNPLPAEITFPRRKNNTVKKRKLASTLVNVSILPESFQAVFSFQKFNRMQSEAFPTLYESDDNCVVSSPTGSGKTVLFELAILRLIKESNFAATNAKILYIAPTKSLCYERLKGWSPLFVNMTVGMLTSDASFSETEKVKKSNIIITTPEKWDILTRKWKDYSKMFELVKLILVDEIHTLRERRGAALEVVLTRMNILCGCIRIIAVSATIPNVTDISEWIKSKMHDRPARVLSFDDSYRQVALDKRVYGYSFNNKNEFQNDSLYNKKLDEVLKKHSKQRPVLIFCPTRASTISTAKYIVQNCSDFNSGANKIQSIRLNDHALSDCFNQGIAFHHAGLSMGDRENVEQGFLKGSIKVLCSTSTLAVGVNLPAYLVIIKGTRYWNSSVVQEYSQLDILQMIGRAGRPQFEKDGCAVILTESKMKSTYEKLLQGTEELESSLHLELIEHLAAEIMLGTVFSTESAVTWLRNTFFYVRFKKNPSAYSEVNKLTRNRFSQDSQLFQFSENLINLLLDYQVVKLQDGKLMSTPFGNAMTRHYVLFETMKLLMKPQKGQSISALLDLLSHAREFSDIRVRQKEKKLYKEVNISPLVRFPYLTEKRQSQIIEATHQKVSLLMQYGLGGLEYPSYSGAFALHQTMTQDKILVFRHCFRVLKCMVDIFVEKKDGISLKNALFILRSANGACWEDSAMVLRQLKSIGLTSVRKLVVQGIHSFQDFSILSDQQIECCLGLKIGNGSKIKKDVELLPKLSLQCRLEGCYIEQSKITANFQVEISAEFRTATWHGQNLSIDIQVSKVTGEMLDFRQISLTNLSTKRSFRVAALIESKLEGVEFSMNCLEVAGLGQQVTFPTADLPLEFHSSLPDSSEKSALSLCLLSSESDQEAKDNSTLSDDSILQYLGSQSDMLDSKGDAAEQENGGTKRKLRSNGNFECHHTCKDKSRCRHLCCKEGVPKDCLRRKKGHTSDKTSNKRVRTCQAEI